MFTLTAVYGVVTVVTAFVGGYWSDRVGTRKPFVIWSGLIAAAALTICPRWSPPRSSRWVRATRACTSWPLP